VDSIAASDPFSRVYEELGGRFLRTTKTHSAQVPTANAGTVSGYRQLDGGRDPLASETKSQDPGGSAFAGVGSETLSIDSGSHNGSLAADRCELEFPVQLVVFASLGSRRKLPALRIGINSGEDRGPYYLLVSPLPSPTKDSDLKL